MDHSLEHHKQYIGQSASQLPTPSLVLSRQVIANNIKTLHETVDKLGISFRPHVKTLKTIEVTEMLLGHGKYRTAVASTLSEIRGMLPLVQKGVLDECLYGLPVRPGALPNLLTLSKILKILLMIDNEEHIRVLEGFNMNNPETEPWGVFIKVNVGSNRAGVPAMSDELKALTQEAESSAAVRVIGFYCHAGHSYACRTQEAAEEVLQTELNSTLETANELASDREVIISVGATPTAHVVHKIKTSLPPNIKLELHAGNFCVNDLQQLCTGLIEPSQQGVRICTEICSVYPDRNEALVNAGVIALSRESSDVPGFGRVVENPDWHVVRLSQEHGILGLVDNELVTGASRQSVTDIFTIGQKVFLRCQHACITAAAFFVYYVVDKDDIVRETWVPWGGW